MSKKYKISLACLGAFLLLLLLATFVLPSIIKTKVIAALEEETGRKIRIESISINPLTFSLAINGFSIAGQKGEPFVSIANLRTSIGMASLFKGALIINELSVEKPVVSFTRTTANSYDFNDIIVRQKAKPKKESKGEFHFSINNIHLTNGSINFDDQAVEGGKKHTVHKLDIAIPFISNIPHLIENYTAPHISAEINGAPFKINGKVKPLSKSLETSVKINLKELNLPEYLGYVPAKLPADLTSGKLTVDGEVNYRISKTQKPELTIKGILQLDQIAVVLKNGKPLVKLPSFMASASNLDVFMQRFLFDEITLEGFELFASRDKTGEWMYQRLLPKPKKAAPPKAKTATAAPEKQQALVSVTNFGVHNATLHFSDALPPGGFSTTIAGIELAVDNFSTAANSSADYELSLTADREAHFSADGMFSLTPLKATSSLELADLKVQRFWPYLSSFLTAPVNATIGLSAEADYRADNGLNVEQANFSAKSLAARYGTNEGFDLARFEIKDAAYHQKENRVDVAAINLSQGNLTLSKEADGSISLLSLLKKKEPAATTVKTSATETKKTATSGNKELAYRLKKIRIDRLNTTFTDKTVADKPRFSLTNTSLSLVNLNGPLFTPAALQFAATFNKATPLKASGDITPAPFRYKGSVSIGRLPLRDFEAYFPDNLNVFILGGFADSSMNVDITLKDGKPFGSYKGSAGIRSFHAIDTNAEEDLLKWESLQFDDIQGNLEPFSLNLKQIALNSVYSRIIIRKDGTLNLQNLVEKPAAGEKQPQAQANAVSNGTPQKASTNEVAGSTPPPVQATKRQINVGAVTIQDGMLSFTDNHLPQQFATTFYNLGGRISGLSSEETKFAEVDLRGNLENHSPLQISGFINPLRDDLFVDLKISFRDIELSPVTPYSGTFLGYTVEKGKLFLDLKYRIDKKQLESENRVFIDQFTLGEKIESDKATKLPVKLGLALLKDRKGEIHLDLPVTGRTDDPKFSIWGVVWQVVKNLLVKAATSPFSLLSSMFGSGEDFSAIQFASGTPALSPQEQQKLTALSKALLDRPALKMELKGYVDREKDTEGYRRELLARKVKNEKLQELSSQGALVSQEKIDSVEVLPEEYPRYLSSVYKKEKFPKPRNALGVVKELPADEMKKLIITNTVVGDTELQTLARERVVAIFNYLVKKGTVPAERIFQKNDDVFKAPAKENTTRSRVELNAIVQ